LSRLCLEMRVKESHSALEGILRRGLMIADFHDSYHFEQNILVVIEKGVSSIRIFLYIMSHDNPRQFMHQFGSNPA